MGWLHFPKVGLYRLRSHSPCRSSILRRIRSNWTIDGVIGNLGVRRSRGVVVSTNAHLSGAYNCKQSYVSDVN
jgi:hypothetical protein